MRNDQLLMLRETEISHECVSDLDLHLFGQLLLRSPTDGQVPWRAGGARSNRLTAWITPVIGEEDTPGAWRFHAKSGSQDLPDHQTAELLAGVFTLMAGHGFQAEKTSFATLSTLAQHPHHHIPDTHRLAAERHIARQRRGELVKVQRTPVFTL